MSETDLGRPYAQRVLGSIRRHLEEQAMLSTDPTEEIRRLEQTQLNAEAAKRQALEAKYEQVWDTDQLCDEFQVLQFMAPYVIVQRRCDGKKGSLQFQHAPRFYFSWEESS